MMRIGHGFDVHRFSNEAVLGGYIVLGGVKIDYTYELLAHSDGDVLLHAVCDALLGAATMGDVGQHFPDTDPRYKDIDSRKLLRHVVSLIHARDLQVMNMDSTIIVQAPKIAPHILAMRKKLANDLQVALNVINVKSTTMEKLSVAEQKESKESIAVHVVVLLGTISAQ